MQAEPAVKMAGGGVEKHKGENNVQPAMGKRGQVSIRKGKKGRGRKKLPD